MNRWLWSAAAMLALVLVWGAPAQAPKDKDFSAKGELAVHQVPLQAGEFYLIRVEGQGFVPRVLLKGDEYLPFSPRDFDREDVYQTHFVPQKTKTYHLTVAVDFFPFDAPEQKKLPYTLSVKHVPLSKKPLLEKKDKITKQDPVYKQDEWPSPHKAYPIKLKAGQYYVIDMIHPRKQDDFGGLDPFLFLEAPDGEIVARDDDGGEDLNARIVYQPKKDGEYRIIATILGKEEGAFTLTVRTQEDKGKK